MVPTETFTSMLDDPSKGSIATMYLPCSDESPSKAINSSFSSEATPQQCPPNSRDAMKVLLASKSSFFTSSPCTFV